MKNDTAKQAIVVMLQPKVALCYKALRDFMDSGLVIECDSSFLGFCAFFLFFSELKNMEMSGEP